MINRPNAEQVLALNTEALIFSLFPETDSPTGLELAAKSNNNALVREWLKQHRDQYKSWRARNDAGFTMVTLAVLVQDIETLAWIQQRDADFFKMALERPTEASHRAPLQKNLTERMLHTEWTPMCFAVAYNLDDATRALLQMGSSYLWKLQKQLNLLTLVACQFNPAKKEPLALQALIERDRGYCRQMVRQNISFPRSIAKFEGDAEVVDNALDVAFLHDASLVVRQLLTLDDAQNVNEMICLAAQSGALRTLTLIKALFPAQFKVCVEEEPSRMQHRMRKTALIRGIRHEPVVRFLLANNVADNFEIREYIKRGATGQVLVLVLSHFRSLKYGHNDLLVEQITARRNNVDIIAALVYRSTDLRKFRNPPVNDNVLHLASVAYNDVLHDTEDDDSDDQNKYIIAKLEFIWKKLGPITFVDMMQEMNCNGETPFVRALNNNSPYVVAWMIAQKCFTFSSKELNAVNAYFLHEVFNTHLADHLEELSTQRLIPIPYKRDEIYTAKIRWTKLLTTYLCEFENPLFGGEIEVLPPLAARYRRLARTYYLLCYGAVNQVFNLSLLAAQNIMSYLFAADLFRKPGNRFAISRVVFSAEDVNDLIQFMANQTAPLWLRYVAYVCKVSLDGAITFDQIEGRLKDKASKSVSTSEISLFGQSQAAVNVSTDQLAKRRRY